MTLLELLRRLKPTHLVGQIALLMLVLITSYQILLIVTFHVMDIEGRRHYVSEADFITSVLLGLDAAEPSQRADFIKEISTATPYTTLRIVKDAPIAIVAKEPVLLAEIKRINSHLRGAASAYITSDHTDTTFGEFALRLRKGDYALISIAQHQKPARFLWRWLWEPEPDTPFLLTRWPRAAFFFFLSSSVLIIWISNTIVSPLIKLSEQAEKFPEDKSNAARIPQRGPFEVRELTKSINRMQSRILDMINARTHLLAAVSHDLKTIITRMSLRSQFISDDEIRVKMEKDIQFMDAMVKNNLQYLKYEGEKSDHSIIDLDSVIQTVTDEFIDLGYNITYHGGDHEQIKGSITEMLRVFTNLIENATRYANHINIYLVQISNYTIQIDIIDDGPGIAEDLKPIIFEPFVRGASGRTMESDKGFGLGLSIVRELLKSHHGSIEFINGEPRGLIARVTLPQIANKI